jgi:GAF domain
MPRKAHFASIVPAGIGKAGLRSLPRMANIQLFDPASAALRIEAQRGFSQPFLEFFDCVHDGHAVCITAFKTRAQIIVEDVAESRTFLGTPALEVVLDAGVRAVVSTPTVGSTGSILGILSTHRRRTWRPRHRDLQRMLFKPSPQAGPAAVAG